MMRIAINAQMIPGGYGGGVEQFLVGLVHALGRLKDGGEEYVIVTHPLEPNWLAPFLGPNQRIVPHPWHGLAERVLGWFGPLKSPIIALAFRMPHPPWGGLLQSNGFWDSLDVDLIHFPFQSMELSSVPSIFNPHDLQHLHYPEFFTPKLLAWREANYPVWCRHAKTVTVASQWIKDDLVERYGVEPEKIHVIPLAAPTEAYETAHSDIRDAVRTKFGLPETFVFCASQTWPHKNHIRLLEALALLRDRDNIIVNLVCTGKRTVYWRTIAKRLRELKLQGQAKFLGFVSPPELKTLYQLAEVTVIPTLFEAGSFPMFEAFREGCPVTSSDVTSLSEQGGDAVLFFDPKSVESIAEAVRRMARDPQLRKILTQRGRARIATFTWERTAKAYRALYRKTAGRPLTEEDQEWLFKNWMLPTKPILKV